MTRFLRAALVSLLAAAGMSIGCASAPLTPTPAARAIAVRCVPAGASVRLGAPQITLPSQIAGPLGDVTFGPVPADLPSGFIIEVTLSTGVRESHQVRVVRPVAQQFILGTCLPVVDAGFQVQVSGWSWERVDPSRVPLLELARIRGSMWTARYPMPWGPRPNDPSNILTLSAIHHYHDKAKEDDAWKAYTGRGYTHGVLGPWWGSADAGYHGQYPEEHLTFDQFLDIAQDYWDHGVTPVNFLKPDNWSCADLESLTPYYAQPRAQRLIRVSVIAWEPSIDTPNAEWVCWAQWQARVLPHALHLIHMVADFDAPGDNNDFTPGRPGFIGMPEAWARVAPYLHGFLSQVGGYVYGGGEVPTAEFVSNFTGLYRFNPPAPGRGSLRDRFELGYAGWPTSSQWGAGKGLLVYAAEYAAFAHYWKNWDERYALDLGDAAMAAGAAGFLDGGRVAVPAPAR